MSSSYSDASLRDTQFTVVLGSVSSEQIESLTRNRYALMFDLRSRRDEALTARPWYTWLRSLAGSGAVRWGGEHLFQPTKEKEEDI